MGGYFRELTMSKRTTKPADKEIAIIRDSMNYYADGLEAVGDTFKSRVGDLFGTHHLSYVELQKLYLTSWIPAKVCTIFADDMTSEGVEWLIDADDAEYLEQQFARYKIWQKLAEAITWARLYGGSIVEIRMKDMKPDQPLNTNGYFLGLRVFDRWEITPDTSKLATGEREGEPISYQVSPRIYAQNYKLDASRAIRFIGRKLPNELAQVNDLWGESYVQLLYTALERREGANIGVAELMKRCHLRYLGVKGFWQAMQVGNEDQADAIIKAMSVINASQNISSLTVADTDDTFQTQTFGFGGFKDVFNQFNEDVAGATDIPLVRLFGISPSGFSTGDTDMKLYAQAVKRDQEAQLRDAIYRIAKVLLETDGRDASKLDFNFIPIIQPTPAEKAQLAQQSVQTILQVYEAGLLPPDRALSEIKRQAEQTGFFASVTPEEIDALKEPKLPMPEGMTEPGNNGNAV